MLCKGAGEDIVAISFGMTCLYLLLSDGVFHCDADAVDTLPVDDLLEDGEWNGQCDELDL